MPSDLLNKVLSNHRDHSSVYKEAVTVFQHLRTRLMIPPAWSIKLEIVCPEDMPDAHGCLTWKLAHYGSFRLAISCELTSEQIEWIIAHELLEALLASYGDFADDMIDGLSIKSVRKLMRERHEDVRDQVIEHMLRVLFGKERPDIFPPVNTI